MDETLEKDINNTSKETVDANAVNQPSEIDTSWIDTFSDDYTNSDNSAASPVDVNDKRDRDRTEAVVAEKEYDPFDTAYFDEPADDYLKEAQSNFQNWDQKAREDAAAGMQFAYNDKELEKAKEGFANTEWTAPTTKGKSTFSDALYGGLSNLIYSDADKARATQLLRDRATEVLDEVRSGKISADEAIKKFNDADFYKENNISTGLGTGTASNLVEQLKVAAPKAEDIAKYGETKLPNMSAKQEAENYAKTNLDPIAKRLMNAIERGDVAEAEKALDLYTKEYANASPATKAYDITRPNSESMRPDIYQNEVNRIKEEAESAPATPATPRPATPRPATPAVEPEVPVTPEDTSTAEAGPMADPAEFEEMFKNPNTQDLEDAASYGAWNGIRYDMKGAIRDPNTGKLLNEPEDDKDKNTTATAVNTTPTADDKDSRLQLHNEELNNFLPVEIINTNPENINGVAEALANNDTETAEYLLASSLSGNNFLQLIESATLGNKQVSPELMAVLQSIWAKLQNGQSVGAINSADLSNISRERSDAISKAFNNYSESSLKDLDYYSRDTNATDESAYNKGLTENTNEVVSDVMKKYVVSNPWIIKAVSKWR